MPLLQTFVLSEAMVPSSTSLQLALLILTRRQKFSLVTSASCSALILEETLVAYAAFGRSTCLDLVIGQLLLCIGVQASFLRGEDIFHHLVFQLRVTCRIQAA